MSVQFVYISIIIVVSISLILGIFLDKKHIASIEEAIKEFTKTISLREIKEKMEEDTSNIEVLDFVDEDTSDIEVLDEEETVWDSNIPVIIDQKTIYNNNLSLEITKEMDSVSDNVFFDQPVIINSFGIDESK